MIKKDTVLNIIVAVVCFSVIIWSVCKGVELERIKYDIDKKQTYLLELHTHNILALQEKLRNLEIYDLDKLDKDLDAAKDGDSPFGLRDFKTGDIVVQTYNNTDKNPICIVVAYSPEYSNIVWHRHIGETIYGGTDSAGSFRKATKEEKKEWDKFNKKKSN